MNPTLQYAFVAGVERVAAWADLLDEINVFPVADGDTGRNLIISLAPMRLLETGASESADRLLLDARGHSGNIAARFFSSLLAASEIEELPDAAQKGYSLARLAVQKPRDITGKNVDIFDKYATKREMNNQSG